MKTKKVKYCDECGSEEKNGVCTVGHRDEYDISSEHEQDGTSGQCVEHCKACKPQHTKTQPIVYAQTSWIWEDVKRWHPDWTKAQCNDWLELNEDGLLEASVSAGNDFIAGGTQ